MPDQHYFFMTTHHSIKPRRRKKWLRQSFTRQTEGDRDTVPSLCSVKFQRGRTSGSKFICKVAPQPQGHNMAANHKKPFSPAT